MSRRPLLITLYAIGALAIVVIAAGTAASLYGWEVHPTPPIRQASAPLPATPLPKPQAPAAPQPPAGPPLTSSAPGAATNGHLTIRLLGR